MYYNRNLITATEHATSTSEASGVFNLQAQAILKQAGRWPAVLPFAVQYTISNTGAAFELRDSGTVNYEVIWGDGSDIETVTTNNKSHTYASSGTYSVKLYTTGSYRPYYNNNTNGDQITAIVIDATANLGTSLFSAFNGSSNMTSFICSSSVTSTVTNFQGAWQDCTSLTSFPLIDTSSGTNFATSWRGCTSLASFPLIDTSGGANFYTTWLNCPFTSFPQLDMSSATNVGSTWSGCSNLTSFPSTDLSSGTSFTSSWYGCSSLTSFPSIDFSSGTTFNTAWRNCTSLTTYPANQFDSTGTLISSSFANAFLNCALTAQSIENILTSLDTNGASNITLSINGGTNAAYSTWSTAAQTALTNLTNKGWTVSYNS